MTDTEMLDALLGAVNDAAALPVTAALDYLAPDAPSASVQQLMGTRIVERWISGGGIGETPFAVLYRTAGRDSLARKSAASALLGLATTLEAMSATDFGYDDFLAIRGETTPVLSERAEDGSEVWRIQMVLESVRRPATAAVS